MTTLVVATDFSDQAHWATNYALELARQLNARLEVVYAYDPLPNETPAHEWLTSTAESQYYQALHKLDHLRQQMVQATQGTVEVSVVARPDATSQQHIGSCLLNEAHKVNADLLIMGVVGEEPLKARQLGSLATDLIPHTPVPLLLVPPGATYHRPQNMVLAVDLTGPVDTTALTTALSFARQLGTCLDVICVDDEPDLSQQRAAQHLRDLLRHQPHTFSFLPGLDVAIALNTYLADHQADLIMLLPKPHSRVRTWLLESVTQEVARLATVPVLAAV